MSINRWQVPLRAREDSHTLAFINRISQDPSKRFVLTSRTNILNQGSQLSDHYSDKAIVRSTYLLAVSDLKLLEKAKILYSHIWHSDTPSDYLDQLFIDNRYMFIIQHKNYNPRLIAFIVDPIHRFGKASIDTYWDSVVEKLTNPHDVWSHFFYGQLNQRQRDLVCLVVLNRGRIHESELKEAFLRIPDENRDNLGLLSHNFYSALNVTTGSILNRTVNKDSTSSVITLLNPSVVDFINSHLTNMNLWQYYHTLLRSVESLNEIVQLSLQLNVSKDFFSEILLRIARIELISHCRLDRYRLRLAALSIDMRFDIAALPIVCSEWLTSHSLSVPLYDYGHYVTVLRAATDGNWCDASVIVKNIETLQKGFEDKYYPLDEQETLATLIELSSRHRMTATTEQLRRDIIDAYRENLPDSIGDSDLLLEYTDPNDSDEMSQILYEHVVEEMKSMNIVLTDDEVQDICQVVDVDSIIDSNQEAAARTDFEADMWKDEYRASQSDETSVIHDLFDRS